MTNTSSSSAEAQKSEFINQLKTFKVNVSKAKMANEFIVTRHDTFEECDNRYFLRYEGGLNNDKAFGVTGSDASSHIKADILRAANVSPFLFEHWNFSDARNDFNQMLWRAVILSHLFRYVYNQCHHNPIYEWRGVFNSVRSVEFIVRDAVVKLLNYLILYHPEIPREDLYWLNPANFLVHSDIVIKRLSVCYCDETYKFYNGVSADSKEELGSVFSVGVFTPSKEDELLTGGLDKWSHTNGSDPELLYHEHFGDEDL